GDLANAAAQAKAAGIPVVPQTDQANAIGSLIVDLQKHRRDLEAVIEQAEGMHDDPEKQAKLLTSRGAEVMSQVRSDCDRIELSVPDSSWPLPKYREMLFPV
ncbi:MAG TPA: glutamine synthetase type III, partial [Gemmatimonadaceae bacterium]